MQSMNLIGKFITNFREFYNEINAATLTGAIDVVVVEQPDGSYTCSPFHVRFGKLGVLRSREKIVDIEVNGEPLDIHMKLGESGEAYFVEELSPDDDDDEDIPPHLACSPIPSHEQLDQWIKEEREADWESQPEAKVFVAETIGDEKGVSRKLSLPSAEFRPIDENQASALTNSGTVAADKCDGLSSSSTSGSQQNLSGKRRRKKKSSLKRKKLAENNSVAQEPSFQPETSVFTLEDIEKPQETEVGLDAQKLNASDSFSELQLLPLTGERDYHFFSDTEVTPGCSPESRPSSPIVSDTEVERRHLENEPMGPPQSWKWGELPSPLPRSPSVTGKALTSPEAVEAAKKEQDEAQRSMLSGMFSFMKKTKHLRQEGVYLSDLNADDPEMAALYFPNPSRSLSVAHDGDCHQEDDAESGHGPSIPHSPTSQSPPTLPGDWNLNKCDLDVAMSLCGQLESDVPEELFSKCQVSYDDFVANPMLIDHPDLVVRVSGKYYNWRTACPLVMSLALFKRPMPGPVVDVLSSELMPASKMEVKEKAKGGGYSSWFTWRRNASAQLPNDAKDVPHTASQPEAGIITEKAQEAEKGTLQEAKIEELVVRAEEEKKEKGYAASNSSEESDGGPSQTQNKLPMDRRPYQTSDKCRKTLRLTSDQIAQLNLEDGANEVEFSVTTAYQGTSRCKCHIYKWRHDDRVVISDIDGTITKSDVLGHVLPIVGKDWAQSGVAQLFTKIKNNGYKLLYLSSRAIGQARVTRDYLRSIKQGDLSLPDGPLLLNPTSLISAFHREVIEKKPEEFKISCLKDIAALFPGETRPFYAGYGNRVNDVYAYRAVGVPIVRIFTINYKGELKHELTRTFQSSYNSMCHLVDEMFPSPRTEGLAEDYSQFVFWRDPLPEVDVSHLCAQVKVEPKGKVQANS